MASWSPNGVDVPRADDLDEALRRADVSVLLQKHRDYDLTAIAATAARLFDTTGATNDPSVTRL